MSPNAPKEGDAYRAQLTAALTRIDALEAELAGRTGGAGSAPSAKLADLERQRADLLEAASPRKVRRAALIFAAVPTALFCAIALVMGLFGSGGAHVLVLPLMGLFMGGLVALIHLGLTPSSTRTFVAKLDKEIAEARRLDTLEAEVRETRRLLQAGASSAQVRVAASEEVLEETGEPADVARREE